MLPALHLPVGPILFLDEVADGELRLAALFATERGGAAADRHRHGRSPRPASRALRQRHRLARPLRPAGRPPSSYTWNGTAYDVAGDLTGDSASPTSPATARKWATWTARTASGTPCGRGCAPNTAACPSRSSSTAATRSTPTRSRKVTPSATAGRSASRPIPPRALADLRHHLRERFLARSSRSTPPPPRLARGARPVPHAVGRPRHLRRLGIAPPLAHLLARGPDALRRRARKLPDLPAGRRRRRPAAALRRPFRPAPRLGGPLRPTCASSPPTSGPNARVATSWAKPAGRRCEAEAARDTSGHTFLMSSVPLLGPRLSILEALMVAIPRMQRYEDDLRDQWQSRFHRDEWRRMLRLVRDLARRDGHDITAVSGEIHLATRAIDGPWCRASPQPARRLGHRAPRAAEGLGAHPRGARFAGRGPAARSIPSASHDCPASGAATWPSGTTSLLERLAGDWRARWDLEASGMTAPLAL